MNRRAVEVVAIGFGLVAIGGPARAEDAAGPQAPAAQTPAKPTSVGSAVYAAPSTAWELWGGLGLGAADGKYGDVLQKPLQWEVGIGKRSASGKWRFGVALQFGSMDPADDPNIPPETADLWLAPDLEWARLETSFSVRRTFNPQSKFRPYVEGRIGIERIHPRSELFWEQPPPEDLEPGDSPTAPANGIGFTIQSGFEVPLGRTLSLDVAGFYTYYKTGSYDMSPLGLPDVDSGIEWGARVGLAWQPFSTTPLDPTRKAVLVDPATGKPLPLPPPDGHRDAWGVPRSWGWATGRDVRDQLGRVDVQRVRARRELQPDQPAQLLEQLQGRLHVRRQQVQDQPADPPLQRLDLLQRRARERDRLLGLSAWRSPAPSSGSAAARRTRCRTTT
jgi:hypothetical protein